MNSTDEPATELQLNQLERRGYQPTHPLSRAEAAHLLRELATCSETPAALVAEGLTGATPQDAHGLRLALETARRNLSDTPTGQSDQPQHELAAAFARRQQFWVDTCREPGQRQTHSEQVLDLHMRFGCRFLAPTSEQTKEILESLDTALPNWDRDHPELFFQSLELNFHELLRHC
jgi:hypothetical protein